MSGRQSGCGRRGRIASACVLLPAGLLWSCAAAGADLRYSLTHLGGSVWEYSYTLVHDGSPTGAAIRQFAIGFDPAVYLESSLSPMTPTPLSTQWDEQILASGPALDAFYDVQAIGGGLATGGVISGLRVRFQWIGPGVPSDQPFWVFEPGNPAPLQQGRTGADSVSIPLGGPWLRWVLIVVLIVLAFSRLNRRRGEGG